VNSGGQNGSGAGPVALVAWPTEAALREALAARGRPRLLVLAEGVTPPPAPDCLEDWIHVPASEEEMRARIDALAARAESHLPGAPHLDDEGFLRYGSRTVHLPPVEARLVGALVERFGRVVGANTLVRAAWPQGTSSRGTLDVRISRLRRRIGPLGLVLRTVRQRGWMLDVAGAGDGDGKADTPPPSHGRLQPETRHR
jgi:two-component system, OmpR family, response regulator